MIQRDYNPIALLIYSTKSGLVSDLMVDGQWIMRNYEIISIKEEEVIEKIKNIREEIFYCFFKTAILNFKSEKNLFILDISK